MIQRKEGICVDCGSAKGNKPLIAKRCINQPNFHYQKHQKEEYIKKQSQKKKSKSKSLSDANNGQTLGNWFNEQINQMPRQCENCEEYLNPYAPWSARAYIAHIVPKRNFLSVMVHPINRLFLCIDCHTKFDNSLSKEIVKMKCWPIAVERFNSFKHLIYSEEVSKLQPCFEEVY